MAFLKFFALVALAGCGSDWNVYLRKPKTRTTKQPRPQEYSLDGTFVTPDNARINLADDEGLPTVLVFSTDACLVCRHEAKAFRDSLADSTVAPTKIKLYSVLVGAIPEDATDWKDDLELPWTVGLDDAANTLYEKYCGGSQVPCTIVHVPSRGIVLSRIGEVTVAEIQALTGPWE